jgi:hypothetical protein
MASSGITSINELPISNNQNSNIQQQMMIQQQQPQNIILNRNEIVSTSNTQMTTSNYNQLLPTGGVNTQNPLTMENSVSNKPPNYNELIGQIQNASAYGTTALPSRDIPMQPSQINNDIQSQPNYIQPPAKMEDYIRNDITPQKLIETNNRQNQYENLFERLYEEFRLPIIIALLYFLFQLPVVKQYNKKLMPFLFKTDGNPNLYGYLANSIMFASMVYILLQALSYLV